MTTATDDAPFVTLERGELRLWARPRVELDTVRTFSDVQALALTLQSGELVRRIKIGRKRLPDTRVRERLWAQVTRVGPAAAIYGGLAESHAYETKTRGVRRQSGAIEIARGTYAIAAHRDHAHLVMRLRTHDDDPNAALLAQLRIVPRASYLAAVFNPDAKRRPDERDDDAPFGEPSLLDDETMERFGERRFASLEPALLDVEGTELVLIGGGTDDAVDQCLS